MGSLENLGMTEIRTATPADAEEIARIYRPYVQDSVVSFELDPPSAEAMAERMAGASDVYPWLVAAESQGLLGYAYGSQHRSRPAYRFSVEVSVYLKEAARGRGLGRRLMTALLDELAARGFNTALAGTTLPNPASITLFTSLGFEQIGVFRHVGFKFGGWHDVSWWQRGLGDDNHETRADRASKPGRDGGGGGI
jgi:L-amino acid N-acyltransferase YncA